jgi:hypothetical protein
VQIVVTTLRTNTINIKVRDKLQASTGERKHINTGKVNKINQR